MISVTSDHPPVPAKISRRRKLSNSPLFQIDPLPQRQILPLRTSRQRPGQYSRTARHPRSAQNCSALPHLARTRHHFVVMTDFLLVFSTSFTIPLLPICFLLHRFAPAAFWCPTARSFFFFNSRTNLPDHIQKSCFQIAFPAGSGPGSGSFNNRTFPYCSAPTAFNIFPFFPLAGILHLLLTVHNHSQFLECSSEPPQNPPTSMQLFVSFHPCDPLPRVRKTPPGDSIRILCISHRKYCPLPPGVGINFPTTELTRLV